MSPPLGNGLRRGLCPPSAASRTASVSVPSAAYGGCTPTRACGRSPEGGSLYKLPSVLIQGRFLCVRIPLIRRPGLFIGGGGKVLRPPAVGGVAQDKAAAELHEARSATASPRGRNTAGRPAVSRCSRAQSMSSEKTNSAASGRSSLTAATARA